MTVATTQPPESPTPHRFTREEYYLMGDAGLFQDRRVELINGEIIDMAPQKNPHVLSVSRSQLALMKAFGNAFWVRTQAPLNLGNDSDPEPDLAVVPGPMESYKDHPQTALLVVEIADTTLRFDRGRKASLYAQAGILDYWIINVVEQCVEVMRDPAKDSKAPFGWRYKSITTIHPPQNVSPLARPEVLIPAADLLP